MDGCAHRIRTHVQSIPGGAGPPSLRRTGSGPKPRPAARAAPTAVRVAEALEVPPETRRLPSRRRGPSLRTCPVPASRRTSPAAHVPCRPSPRISRAPPRRPPRGPARSDSDGVAAHPRALPANRVRVARAPSPLAPAPRSTRPRARTLRPRPSEAGEGSASGGRPGRGRAAGPGPGRGRAILHFIAGHTHTNFTVFTSFVVVNTELWHKPASGRQGISVLQARSSVTRRPGR